MLTDFQKKKLGRLFDVLDADGNHQLERADYTAIIANLAAMHDWKPGSPEYTRLAELYYSIWDSLKALADQNADGIVSQEEFLEFHAQMLTTPELFKQLTIGTVDILFEAFDRDQDGNLSRDDFRDFFAAYRIKGSAAADEAFQRLDLSGDGRLSKSEAVQRVHEYYCSNDAAAGGNWFFGRYE